jgi:hypothetical protein
MLVALVSFMQIGYKAMAQEKTAQERAKTLTLSMNCELGLYAEQIPKINAINLKAALRMDTVRRDFRTNNTEMQKRGQIIDRDRDLELRDALNPSQFTLYERISKGNQSALKKTAVCRKEGGL